ncbi:exopolysaccharide biosynthesis polyprenyl glycosylphosphotransferase [Aquidulcibacter sp.]|uniref:exopolysaccharide biosynthesis polyprenyl glycosylphosphotransferase n=1 Tax=Aquidulcibacter sp. TaxID=2052990 RepID=UPI0025BFF885|nr:exopolysaccharide biosynthesis polyprenyl glycosylphosphotransferase [Aquidulcibacter sp.]MCA3692331.1 exopolysaccharide biosynthesis polyprenyl glycosylphosphotransferase [Aquidulcibacter sp.]
MARVEYRDDIAGDQPVVTARKAARGARWYRSSFGRALGILDIGLILLVMTYVLKVVTDDHVLTTPISAFLPMALGGLCLWWILREHDLYRFDAEPLAVTHGIKTLGAVVLALPSSAAIGALVAVAVGRAAEVGAWEASIATLLAGSSIVSLHFFAALILGAMNRAGLFSLNVVIVGATPLAHKLIEEAKASGDISVLGVFDDRLDRAEPLPNHIKLLGDLDDLMSWPHLPSIDRVIVAVSSTAQNRVLQLVTKLRSMPNKVVLAIDMQGFDSDGTTIGRIGNRPVAYVSGAPEDAKRAFWKRVQDLALGSLFLLLVSPVMALIAVAIKVDSKGPIFFRQKRHGFNNQAFECWKFRSMRVETTDACAAQQVMQNDPRVTRVGRFIRATSLDELPQLFNVLAGTMSLVGPRPHAIGMKTGDEDSEALVAEYAHRHRIKPGMTGWAAIHGSRGPVHSAEEVAQRVAYDLAYIRDANLWLDLWIMVRTLPALLGDKGSVR